jgi:hypothetical protein
VGRRLRRARGDRAAGDRHPRGQRLSGRGSRKGRKEGRRLGTIVFSDVFCLLCVLCAFARASSAPLRP